MRSQSCRRDCGSSPVVGSSRNSSSGSPTSAHASASRCFCPPDSVPTRACASPRAARGRSLRPARARAEEAAEQRERFDDGELLGRAAFPEAGCRAAGADSLASVRQRRPSTSTSPASARSALRRSRSSSSCRRRSDRAGRSTRRRDVEVEAVDGDDVLVGFAKAADVYSRQQPSSVQYRSIR